MIAIALPHFASNLTVILGRDSLPQYAPLYEKQREMSCLE